jgi:cytochrome c peroxidase
MNFATPLTISAVILLSLSASVWGEEIDPPAFAYLLHCSGCHLEDGSSAPPIVPDLRYGLGPLLTIPEGRSYLLGVPGVTDTPIPASEMAGLMNWLIGTLYPDRTDFEPFTVEEINDGRLNRLDDPLKARGELFLKLLGSTDASSD